jgi:hypothetical protein
VLRGQGVDKGLFADEIEGQQRGHSIISVRRIF